jgi:arabinogalactan endo-1,4-beta-galactosidase
LLIQLEAKNQLVQLGKRDKEINVKVDIDFKYSPLHVDEIFKTTQ